MNSPIEEADEEICKSLQQEEYEVLQSIYPDYLTNEKLSGLVKLEIPIELGKLYSVDIREDGSLAHQSAEAQVQTISLSTLPPLLLEIILPPSYPLLKAPDITSLRPTHFWLHDLSRLEKLLTGMWQPGEGVLYNWTEFLRTGDFLQSMELATSEDVILLSHPAPRVLASSLESYETLMKSTQFNNNSYLCPICFMTFKGTKCLRLSCNHTFCRSCLAEYWMLCIAEGEIGRVACADPECVKAGREAKIDEVARVVTEEEVKRWKWLREKRTFERDPSMIHCPMSFCQTAVSKPAFGDDEDNMWSRFRQCDACGYTFCSMCKRLWHGPHTACSVEHSERLVQEYLATEEGSEKRSEIERQYGRKAVLKLVKQYEEDMENQKCISSSTTGCPGCELRVEKSQGCNHMTCRGCGTHFCYRCGKKLEANDPYKHFSTPGLSCYYKLFDSSAEEWQEVEGLVDVI